MKIEFYEEFPNKKNFEKLKLISWPTKLFIAASSMNEFKRFEKLAKSYKTNLEVAYWPIIKNSYYISPFSNPADLVELFKELNSKDVSLLIDIELPMPLNMIIKNLFNIKKNKRLIHEFIDKNSFRVTVPQMPFAIYSKFYKKVGLVYEGEYEKNPMYYSSMSSKRVLSRSRKFLENCKNKKEYAIGLGTIALGRVGSEPILLPKNLDKDLSFVEKNGFEKVIIFRLGGLNKKYLNVLERFI